MGARKLGGTKNGSSVMTPLIREHELVEGKAICRHCGCKWGDTGYLKTLTCIARAATVAGEPKARGYACEDSDVITGRLGELRAERDAALTGTSE